MATPIPTRDETKLIVAALFGGPGGRVTEARHGARSEPLPLGEVMGDLVAEVAAAKRRHPSTFAASR